MNGMICYSGEVKFYGKGPLSSNILDFIIDYLSLAKNPDIHKIVSRFMAHVFVVGNHAPSLHLPYVHITW